RRGRALRRVSRCASSLPDAGDGAPDKFLVRRVIIAAMHPDDVRKVSEPPAEEPAVGSESVRAGLDHRSIPAVVSAAVSGIGRSKQDEEAEVTGTFENPGGVVEICLVRLRESMVADEGALTIGVGGRISGEL